MSLRLGKGPLSSHVAIDNIDSFMINFQKLAINCSYKYFYGRRSWSTIETEKYGPGNGLGVAVSDTHVFLSNEYFIKLNTAD